ncbi:hypothetical protein ACWC0A_39500 [Streptomyces scopuliridis]
MGALLALLMATAAQVKEHVITATVFGPTLWVVVVVVSAVPPLVAAHVLHIDPPTELPDVDQHEAPAQEPQEAAGEPVADSDEQLSPRSLWKSRRGPSSSPMRTLLRR